MNPQQKTKVQQKQSEKPGAVKTKKQNQPEFPLNKENFILMGVGLLLMVIGYIFMSGKEDIFSFQKLSLSVIFVLGGFVFLIYAIMKKPRKKNVE